MDVSLRHDIIEELVKNSIVMVFPVATAPAELYGVLKTVLQYGVQQLQLEMQEDLAQTMQGMLNPGWGTPVNKARMMRMIVKDEQLLKIWKEDALLEAETGNNWAITDVSLLTTSYTFIGGPA